MKNTVFYAFGLLVFSISSQAQVTFTNTTNNEKIKRFGIDFNSGVTTTRADVSTPTGSLTAAPDGFSLDYFVTAPFGWNAADAQDAIADTSSSFIGYLTNPTTGPTPGLGLNMNDFQSPQNVHGQSGGLGNAQADNDLEGNDELLLFNFGGITGVDSGLDGVSGFQVQNFNFLDNTPGNLGLSGFTYSIFIFDSSENTLIQTVTDAFVSGSSGNTFDTGFIGEFDDGDFLIVNGGSGQFRINSITVDVIPEPASATLIALSLAGVVSVFSRRRRRI